MSKDSSKKDQPLQFMNQSPRMVVFGAGFVLGIIVGYLVFLRF